MKTRAVALVLLSVLLSACPETEQPRSARTPASSPSPSVSPSPTSAPGLPSPERFLMVATQRPPATHSIQTFYLGDNVSLRRQRVEFPSPLGQLVASPDGRRLARFSGRTLWTASADHPTRFRRIATARGSGDTGVRQVIWDRGSEALVYLASQVTPYPDRADSKVVNQLFTARYDGSGKRLIKRFETPSYVVLKAFDVSKRRLFWFETGDGGFEDDLTEVNTDTGAIVRIYRQLPTDIYTSFAMSKNLQTAWYATTGVVAEFSLITGRIRTLYKPPTQRDEAGNQSTILHSVMHPRYAAMFFTVHEETSDKEITFSLNLRTGSRTPLFGKPGLYNLAVVAASPTGRYLWLENLCTGCGAPQYDNSGEYYVLDVRTHRVVLVAEDSPENRETIQFLCWLRT